MKKDDKINELQAEIFKLKSELFKMQSKLEKATKALEFYAEDNNYDLEGYIDLGATAVKTLKEIRGEDE